MSAQDDKAYFSRRAVEERQRQAEADDPAIAAVHARLALQYEKLAAEDAEPYRMQSVQENM